MVTSNASNQQTVAHHDADKMVQVAEAYSYLSDQKEINLDSIPLPISPPPSKQEQPANILEQTIIKQKRLARFKNTDLRRKILLKRTFDLVCEIMDHENGFDFEDETETINKKQETSAKKVDYEEEEEDDDDSSSDSDSDSSDDEEDDNDSSSSSGSSDESDTEEEGEADDEEKETTRPNKQPEYSEIDQLIPKPSESKSSLKIKLAWNSDNFAKTQLSEISRIVCPGNSESNETSKFSKINSDSRVLFGQEPEFAVVIQNQSSEDLDFTELNSIDISENYDDSAFNLDQITCIDEQQTKTQLFELKTFQDSESESSTSNLKRKRNSFEETVHQNEQDLFVTSASYCVDSSCLPNNDQQIFYANPSLASLSDSTCFYNNQPNISTPIKSIKRAHANDDLEVDSGKRLKSN